MTAAEEIVRLVTAKLLGIRTPNDGWCTCEGLQRRHKLRCLKCVEDLLAQQPAQAAKLQTQASTRKAYIEDELQPQLAAAREALEFYADEANWRVDLAKGPTVGEDSGDIARAAMKSYGGRVDRGGEGAGPPC